MRARRREATTQAALRRARAYALRAYALDSRLTNLACFFFLSFPNDGGVACASSVERAVSTTAIGPSTASQRCLPRLGAAGGRGFEGHTVGLGRQATRRAEPCTSPHQLACVHPAPGTFREYNWNPTALHLWTLSRPGEGVGATAGVPRARRRISIRSFGFSPQGGMDTITDARGGATGETRTR